MRTLPMAICLAVVMMVLAACSGGPIPAQQLVTAIESLSPPPALGEWSEIERDVLEAGPVGRCAADAPCPRATIRYATVVEPGRAEEAIQDLLGSGDLKITESEPCRRRPNVAPSASLPLCTIVGERDALVVEASLHTSASLGGRFGWTPDDPRSIVTLTAFGA